METASEIVQNHDAYLNLRRSNLKITLIDLNSFKSTKEKEKRSTRYQKWIKSNEIRFSSKYSISVVQRRNRETIFDSSVGSTSLLFEQRLYQEPTKRSRSWLAGRWLFCLWEAGCAVWFCWLSNRSSGSRSRALCYVTRTAGISLPSPASRHDDVRAKDWILRLPACSPRADLNLNGESAGQVWNFAPFHCLLLPARCCHRQKFLKYISMGKYIVP